MKTKTIRCQGQCVSCLSENINYDTFQYEGDYGYYPYECQECGNEGREYYNIIYDVSSTRIKLN
mgnify:FL=1